MNKWRFFTFIFLLIYVVDHYGMEKKESCTNFVGELIFPERLSAIMCTAPEKLGIMYASYYTTWNYNTHETLTYSSSGINAEKDKVYFHPVAHKILFIAENGIAYYEDYSNEAETETKSFFDSFYSGLFNTYEPVLYLIGQKYFDHYDYKTRCHSRLNCETELGTLFTCPSAKSAQPYFLCSDRSDTIMYKMMIEEDAPLRQKIKIKKLFDFPFAVDLSSWAYCAQEKLFFFINKHDQRMYSFNLHGIKKHKVPNKMYRRNEGFPDNSFPVGAIKLHPNQRVLIVMSEERDRIEYVDVKNYDTIRHLQTTTHEPWGYDKRAAQKMAVSCDGVMLLLAAERECHAIEIPLEIREISFLEKTIMKMICEQSGIPKDVRKLIWYFLIKVLKKDLT